VRRSGNKIGRKLKEDESDTTGTVELDEEDQNERRLSIVGDNKGTQVRDE